MPHSTPPDPSPALDLFERSPTPLAHANVEGTLLAVNSAMAQALGRDASALAGTALRDLVHPADRDAAMAAWERRAGGDHRFAHADGTWRVLRWRAAPAGSGGGVHVGAHDVTADRAALDALVAELDELTAAVSHDLRAPLRAIDGFSRILLADDVAGLPDDTRRFLALVRDCGNEVAELLDALVDVARVGREPLAPREVDVAAIAGEVVETRLRPRQGDRDVTWVVGALPPATADPRMLHRLLEALLDNALKFTAPHARAQIEVGWDADAAAYVVRDDGVGVAGELPVSAFGLFRRLHARDEFAGAGAGLALARRIVTRHGGRIWGQGSPGGGLEIRFTLGAAG